ncbi:hypothetical protein OG21DRAFT_209538, partial [Imleria badia]
LTTKIIEIRPLEQLWEESSEHWRIDCASGQYRMYRGDETLVDSRSSTYGMISKCFEWQQVSSRPENLLITTSPIDSASMLRLSVTLPYYGLSFFVNEKGELESREFKHMVYDENQCVGTLLGLHNLLVLRPKTHLAGTLVPEALIPRRVLIPQANPRLTKEIYSNHVLHLDLPRRISHDYFRKPVYHTYNVDAELGCLIGNGSLTSTEFLAYLHAVTSYHRPDPLTGKTGAQAAISLLRSAGCQSIMKSKALVDRIWDSAPYPQIKAAYKEIENRYYWTDHGSITATERRIARRATYLFPSNVTGPMSPLAEYRNHDESNYLTTGVPREPRLDRLLCSRLAPELPARSILLRSDNENSSSENAPLLDQLFSALRTDIPFQREYLAHLNASAQHLRVESRRTHKLAGGNLIDALRKHFEQCKTNYLSSLDILKKSLGP